MRYSIGTTNNETFVDGNDLEYEGVFLYVIDEYKKRVGAFPIKDISSIVVDGPTDTETRRELAIFARKEIVQKVLQDRITWYLEHGKEWLITAKTKPEFRRLLAKRIYEEIMNEINTEGL